jgi:mannose/fructose/sorbose-specific phosphotransferase system IIA component
VTVPVILVGHGDYAAGVRQAAEMILGPQPAVATVSLPPNGSTEALADEVAAAIERLGGGSGALVLADVFGGSPANAAGRLVLRDPAVHLVTGLNLPMVLEVLTSQETSAAALAGVAAGAGRDGVVDAGARLRAAADRARE